MKWEFRKHVGKQYKWKAYKPPGTPGTEKVYSWCWGSFGQPGELNTNPVWNCHGGWIELKGDEELVMFKLRWPACLHISSIG